MKRVFKYLLCQQMVVVCLFLSLLEETAAGTASVKLRNGSFLDIAENVSLPRQTVMMVFPGGPSLVAKELQGTTDVISDILNEGPASMSPDDYRRALFLANADIKVGASMRAMFVTVRAPATKLRRAIELATKTLREPRLNIETFNHSYAKVMTQTKAAFDVMQTVVFRYAVRRATFYDPSLFDGSGSPATLKNVTLAVVRDAYPVIFNRSHLYFVSAGPAESSMVSKVLNEAMLSEKDVPKFVRSVGREIDFVDIIKKSPAALNVAVIDKPNAVDNQILYVFPEFIPKARKEEVVASVAHQLLGGGLVGRLGRTLRKERGLTYHASSLVGQAGWMIYTFGGDEQVEPLLRGVLEVVAAFKKERLSDSEISEAKFTQENLHRERYELPSDVLTEKIRLRLFGRDENYVTKYRDYLKSVSESDVASFVRDKMSTKSGLLVLMGDSVKLKKALHKAGYSSEFIQVIDSKDVM